MSRRGHRGRIKTNRAHRHGNNGNNLEIQGQPVPEVQSNVRCEICGFPVDPKRLHFHMVRFHGAAMKPARPAV